MSSAVPVDVQFLSVSGSYNAAKAVLAGVAFVDILLCGGGGGGGSGMSGSLEDSYIPGGSGGYAGDMVLITGAPISAIDSLFFSCGTGGYGGGVGLDGSSQDGQPGNASIFWRYSANGGAGGSRGSAGSYASHGQSSVVTSFRWSALGLVNRGLASLGRTMDPSCGGGGMGSSIYSNGVSSSSVSDPSQSDSLPVGGVASSSPSVSAVGVSGQDGANGAVYGTYFGCGGAGGVSPPDFSSRAGGDSVLGGGGGGGSSAIGQVNSPGGKGGDGWLLVLGYSSSP